MSESPLNHAPQSLPDLLQKSSHLQKEAEKVKLAGLIQRSRRLRTEAERTRVDLEDLDRRIDEDRKTSGYG